MSRHSLEAVPSCSIYTGMVAGDQIWISIPNNFGKYYSGLYNSIFDAAILLSFATNAITTFTIAYKLWCVTERDSLDPVAYHEVLLQELSYILREGSRLDWAKESSADRIDSSRRIRSCLPHIPC